MSKRISTVLEKRDQSIGRSKGGLTIKIHTRTDASGNPTGFYLTSGAAHDLSGSDKLLDTTISKNWLADKAYDADTRVLEPIRAVQGHAIIPSKSNRLQPRVLDEELYKARHLIENFFAKIKQYGAIATWYDNLASHFLSAIRLVASVVWLN